MLNRKLAVRFTPPVFVNRRVLMSQANAARGEAANGKIIWSQEPLTNFGDRAVGLPQRAILAERSSAW